MGANNNGPLGPLFFIMHRYGFLGRKALRTCYQYDRTKL